MNIKIKDAFFAYQMADESEINRHGRPHTHGPYEFEIHYYLQGNGIFNNKGHEHILTPGTLFYSRPGEKHAISRINKKIPFTFYAILFEVIDPVGELRQLLYETLTCRKKYQVGTNFRFFFEELKEKKESKSTFRHQSAVHQLLSFLYELGSRELPSSYSDEASLHIESGLRIMQENVQKNMSIREIAGQLNISDAHFVRLFRKKMRISPKKYYNRLKIEAAAYMLINSESPIYVIAERLKFSSEFHFSKTFKDYKEMSPSEFRRRNRTEPET